MSGILRLANTGAGTGRSTLQSAASNDVTFNLPDTGSDSTATILTSDLHSITSVNWDGMTINITNADFNVDSGTLFVDESTNRVGIGTTSPQGKLTILGTDVNSNTGRILNVDDDTPAAEGVGGSIAFRANIDGSQRVLGVVKGFQDNSNAAVFDGGLAFETRTNGIASTDERMRISRQGYVGINTTDPTQYLHVRSTGNTQALIQSTGTRSQINFQNSSTSTCFIGSNEGDFRVLTNDTDRFHVDFNGRVGVGSTDPTQQFEVVNGTKNQGLSIVRNMSGAIEQRIILSAHSGGNTITNAWLGSNPKTLHFENFNGTTDTSEVAMAINASSLVGIGTNSPDYRLQVSYGSTSGVYNLLKLTTFNGTNGKRLEFNLDNQESTACTTTINSAKGGGATPDLAFAMQAVEAMRIDRSGRLLIGTTSPDSVGGDTNLGLYLRSDQYSKLVCVRANSDTAGGELRLGKTKASGSGSALVSNNDNIGRIRFCAGDGTDVNSETARISSFVDGTPGANDMPGRLVFATTADGSSTPTERLRIDSRGAIATGGNNTNTVDSITVGSSTSTAATTRFVAIRGEAKNTSVDNIIGFSTVDWRGEDNVSAYTTTAVSAFYGQGFDLGNNQSVTNAYGFRIASDFTGASNNYGFHSNIAASAGRWNFYAAGDASNYFAGNVNIGTTTEIIPSTTTNEGFSFRTSVPYLAMCRQGNPVLILQRTSTNGEIQQFYRDTTQVGNISVTGSATQYNSSSDYRLKENVVAITGAADRVKALKPCRFNFIAEPGKTVDGFLAHEAQEVVPEAVTGEKDGEKMQAMDAAKLVPLLTAALQEALTEISELKERVKNLEG